MSLCLMLGTFFVNSAGLFMLSSIIEKNRHRVKINPSEVTTVNMPPALIEGSETVIFFTLMIIFQSYLVN